MFLKPLQGLVFNSQKCRHTFMDWDKKFAWGIKPQIKVVALRVAAFIWGFDLPSYLFVLLYFVFYCPHCTKAQNWFHN
jgi:hypothetical protein